MKQKNYCFFWQTTFFSSDNCWSLTLKVVNQTNYKWIKQHFRIKSFYGFWNLFQKVNLDRSLYLYHWTHYQDTDEIEPSLHYILAVWVWNICNNVINSDAWKSNYKAILDEIAVRLSLFENLIVHSFQKSFKVFCQYIKTDKKYNIF